MSEDPRECANLFRSLGGSSHPLLPPQDMVEEEGYEKVTQLMVKVTS